MQLIPLTQEAKAMLEDAERQYGERFYIPNIEWAWHRAYAEERRRNGEPGISLVTFTTYCDDINEAWGRAEAHDIGLWMKRGALRDDEPVTYLVNPVGAWNAAHAEQLDREALSIY